MTLEERILKLKDSQVGWFDGHELRVIAEDVCKMENRIKRLEDCAETAWGIIANVDSGSWQEQRSDWREAATRWRDKQFHPELSERKAKEAKP